MGAYQYRHFLFNFWIFFMPAAVFIFVGLVWIGVRYPEGAVKNLSYFQVEWGSLAYALLCTWPLVACSLRRLHDLNLRVRDVIWIFSPAKSRAFGHRMVHERGTIGPNEFGPDPEVE